MIRINLLPVREWRRREIVRKQISVFFLSVVLILAVLLGIGVTVQGKIQSRRQEIASLETEKAKLSYVDAKTKAVEEKRKEIEDKFKAIEALQQDRTLAVRVLDEAVTALPLDRLWLTNLSLKGLAFDLSGVALDNHTVALYMRRLGVSPLCQSVDLLNTKRGTIEGHDLMEFKLKAVVRRSKENKDEKGQSDVKAEGKKS